MIVPENALLELSLGLAAVVIILKILFDFLKPVIDRILGNGKGKNAVDVSRLRSEFDLLKREIAVLSRQVDELHQWHDARTEDGGFRWYVPSTLEKAIETLAQNIAKQTDVLREVATVQSQTCSFMERIERRMDKEIK